MKIRSGFVSNSSSSSFVVAYKNVDLNVVKEILEDIFKVPDNYPIPNLGKRFAECFYNGDNVNFSNLSKYYDEEADEIIKLLKEDYTVFVGSFSNESYEPLEAYLCDIDLNYTSEDGSVVIRHTGGF